MRRTSVHHSTRLGTSVRAVAALWAAGATAGLVVSLGVAAPAAADPIGDCTTTTGVIVAVDFAAWGGDIERGCDAHPTTGYAALHAAGFTTAGDAQDGPAFICRIDDEPSPAEQSCITTPPADAYWSYWHADAGQNTWTYSQLGAMSYHPPPGSVDAWTFGTTDISGTDGQPNFPPSAVRATSSAPPSSTTTTGTPASTVPTTTAGAGSAPSPAQTTPAGAGGEPAPGVHTSSSSMTNGGGAAGKADISPTMPSPTTTTSSGGHGRAPADGRPSIPKIVEAAPAAKAGRSAGSPVPVVVGSGVVVALAGATGVVARRRRRVS